MMKRGAAALLGSLLLGLPAMATDYYVSSSGNDLQAGDISHPWATLARASQSSLKPGDTVYLRGGDIFTGPLKIAASAADKTRSGKTLTITSYGKGSATIRVRSGSAIEVSNLGHIAISKLRLVGSGKGSGEGNGVDIRCDLADGIRLGPVTMEDIETTGFPNAGILVSVATPKGNSGSGYDGVTIRRCTAWGNTRYGILVLGDLREPADGSERRNFSNVNVIDCVVHDNPGDPAFLDNHSGDGILIGSVDGGSIERCIARHNGAHCNCTIGGPVAIWAYASRRVTIRDCTAFENRTGTGTDGGGFDLDGGCEDCLIEHCYSRNNDGGGYLLFDFDGAPFHWSNNALRSCVSVNDGRKGEFGGVVMGGKLDGAEISRNTIFTSSAAPAGKPACLRFSSLDGRSRRLRFLNNTLVGAPDVSVIAQSPPDDSVFLDNLYRSSTGQPRFDNCPVKFRN